jgi:hypothetical protein
MNKPCRVDNTETALLPDGYLAVYHTEKKLSYVIPPLGGIVWELCDGDHSIDEIVNEVKALVAEHGAPAEGDLATDVENLLKKLSSDGLLKAATP